RDLAFDHPTELPQLLDQGGASVQTAGRIDQHDVRPTRRGGAHPVEDHRRRISPGLVTHDFGVRPFGPDLELLTRRRAERIGRASATGGPARFRFVLALPTPLTPSPSPTQGRPSGTTGAPAASICATPARNAERMAAALPSGPTSARTRSSSAVVVRVPTSAA